MEIAGQPALVLCDQIATVDLNRLAEPAGFLSLDELQRVDAALALVLDLSMLTGGATGRPKDGVGCGPQLTGARGALAEGGVGLSGFARRSRPPRPRTREDAFVLDRVLLPACLAGRSMPADANAPTCGGRARLVAGSAEDGGGQAISGTCRCA